MTKAIVKLKARAPEAIQWAPKPVPVEAPPSTLEARFVALRNAVEGLGFHLENFNVEHHRNSDFVCNFDFGRNVDQRIQADTRIVLNLKLVSFR